MREGQPWWKIFTLSYAWPLLKSSMTQQIRFEQYGELPDRLKIKYESANIEESVQKYVRKNPYDRFAFLKGLIDSNRWNFAKFLGVRICMQADDFIVPYLILNFITWIQDPAASSFDTTLKVVAATMVIPILNCMWHLIWSVFEFQMIECGHRAHTAMKIMLFKKNLRMTGATNKDFSSGEIEGIIMHETNSVWTIIWSFPDFVECPLHLIFAACLTFNYIGYYGLIVLLFTLLQIGFGQVRGKFNQSFEEKAREKQQVRRQQVSESFQNIRAVKLYGWESKFLSSIESIYQEEMDLQDQAMLRNKVFDVIGGILHHAMPICTFFFYVWAGNELTLSQMALTNIMLDRIRGRIHQMPHLYRMYFNMQETMDKLWSFYCAPEIQRGLIKRVNDPSEELALTVRGNFSWGVTPAMDKGEKDRIKSKIRDKKKETETKGMGRIRKAIYEMTYDPKSKVDIPHKARSIDKIITLNDMDLEVKKGSFVVIIGEIGSGKTSLLSAMIGEMLNVPNKEIRHLDRSEELDQPKMQQLEHTLLSQDFTKTKSPIMINGTTSFVEQQAWIQNGKLRDNVLFGSTFDKRRYVETMLACQLEPDLAIMPAGDMTEIGEKGINLSGG